MRLLGAVRLSRNTDESVSIEQQRAKIQAYAGAFRHQIVAVAEDTDVSGAVPPRERPQLGPWLARPDEWDALIIAKLDRLSRSLYDFTGFYRTLEAQGKVIICLEPSLDFSTKEGRLVADILIRFAEYERELIMGRTKDAHAHIKQSGAYAGGEVPFGLTVVKADGRGWAYGHDPTHALIVTEMAQRALSGQSLRQIAAWLNEENIPTSRNLMRRRKGRPEDSSSIWRAETVRHILTSPAIGGLHATNGKPLRGPDRAPVRRCEPIIDAQTQEKVKQAISGPSHRPHRPDSNPLLGVAHCGACSSVMYVTAARQGQRYYRCARHAASPRCESRTIPADLLEATAADLFLEAVGGEEITERVPIPAQDHAAELAEVDETLQHLDAERKAGRIPAAAYARLTSRWETERERLAALPSRPASFELKRTGQTFRQKWDSSTTPQRRRLMSGASFRVMTSRAADGSMTVLSLADRDLAARARAAAGKQPVEPFAPTGLTADLGSPIRMVVYGPPGKPVPSGIYHSYPAPTESERQS